MKKSRKNKLQSFFKQGICGLLAFMMLITAFPLQALAADLDYDKTTITSQQNLNKEPVTIKKAEGKSAEDIVKNPDMPKLYTMRADYKLPRNDEEVIGYQPYIATVGDDEYTYTDLDDNEDQKVLTEEEKSKIDKIIDLPGIDGYTSPTKSFHVNYDYIKENAKKGNLDVNEYIGRHPYLYKAKRGTIKIKHTFQMLENRDEYGFRDGDNEFIYTSQNGLTGTSVTIKALDGEQIKGYVPEVNVLTTQVPQNSNDFEIEMRYNRAIYDVNFDSNGGTDLPGMTLIYGQTIPKLNFDIKKAGSELQGWKADKDINYTDVDGNKKTLPKDTLITKADFEAGGKFQDGIKYAMPAESLTFTAEWTENKTAEYVIQFWTEKPDYDDQDDTLALRDRYDFIGARRVDNAETGSTPNLTDLDIHGITFPDLNEGRLEKAQDDKEEFERYYFLNEDLTKKQNASEKDPTVQKSVLSTGETVYNVYYDRRVYTLYFTAANEEGWDPSSSYWPTLTRNGQVIGKEGSPYKVEARFNQSLDKIWPKDEEISNLPPASSTPGVDMGPIGWTINVNEPGELIFRDTPPYRLSAEDFIDSQDIVGTGEFEGNGHGDKIPIGENQTKDREKYEISLAATSWDESVVHHIDIIKDDFDGNEQIDYDLSYWKSDTNAFYAFILPNLQGFTLKKETREAEWVLAEPTTSQYRTINDLNNARNDITPFRSDADKIQYIDKFPWGTKFFDGRNAYNYANYSRNKYKLKLNNDPKIVKNDGEYGAGNILDVPYEMPLKDLKLDTGHVPTRPAWVPEDWSFLGWALDPAGQNLVKDGNETKLHYDQVLYAKWGEPETIWKVKFDPNGGSLRNLSTENITNESKKLEIDGVSHTYPEKVDGEANTFNLVHKMTLKEPKDANNNIIEPTRPGYNFAGWEFVRYTKDENGNDTETEDTSYKDLYKVPEMYHFGNKVVSNVHLRAIWNKQDLITVESIHHFLNLNYEEESKEVQNLYNRRVGSYTTGLASRQDDKYLLVPQAEWDALYNANTDYKTYKDETNRDNSYNQILRVEPEKVHDSETGDLVGNPKEKNNRFEFFYKPFKERVYQVNYLDERGKAEVEAFMEKAKAAYQAIKDNEGMTSEEKSDAYKELLASNKEEFAKIKEKYAVIPSETVVNGKRHYDARNYRKIPGWVLNDKPQQQLFFDIYEDTDTFAGINETGLDEINFFYKDVRIIEVKDKDDPIPDGYKRVTFIAEDGGNFRDDKDNPVKELYYDVIVGLKSDNLPVPEKLKDNETKEEGKYYITADNGKKFIKWDNEKLLNSNTIIDRDYTFTAYFDWSGVKVNELVRTESYKDPDGKWTNDFVPTINELKAQVKWVNKDGTVSNLPADATVTLVDDAGNPLTQDDIYKKVKEMNKSDTDELVRTEIFKAKVTFKGNQADKEVDIPVKIYKNRYEALTSGGKPEILSKAENKNAVDGGLKEILEDTESKSYVKVTVAPTGNLNSKDNKVYYVNPKAWVEIPEIELTDEEKAALGFTNWTADKREQNEKQEENGIYDFAKRHKFTEDTIISPGFSKDVVPQNGEDKPKVPDSFVKVIVKTTDKATDETAFERTFWVNPTKEVTILLANPRGKENQEVEIDGLGKKNVNYIFKEWQKVQTGDADDNLADVKPPVKIDLTKNQYTDKVTIIEAAYKKSIQAEKIDDPLNTNKLDIPQDKKITDEDLISKITPQKGKEIDSITVIENPDTSEPGSKKAKVIVKYKDGSSQGTNDSPVVIPVEVHKKIIPELVPGQKPEGAMDNYVKVVFKAGEGGTLSGDTVYYVSPEVEVDMNESANKITKNPSIGYTSNGGNWSPEIKSEMITDEKTYTFNFVKSDDVIEKNDDPSQVIPDGYVTVIFRSDENGKLEGNVTEKTYFVNPKAGIKLVELEEGQTAGDKELVVPKTIPNEGFEFAYWSESLDLTNSIKGNREYVAHFTKGQVTLTYDAGGATGTVPDPESTNIGGRINLSYPRGLSNGSKNFIGWMIDGRLYQAGSPLTLTENKIAVAQWTEDIYPADEDGNKTEDTPENYVKVTLVPTEKAIDSANKIYYVNPDKYLKIPAEDPELKEDYAKEGYSFSNWDKPLFGKFVDGTVITAKYKISSSPITPLEPDAGIVETRVGIEPKEKDYKDKITPPKGKTIESVEIIEKPDVSKEGVSSAKVNVIYTDGSSSTVDVTVVVYGKIPEKPDYPDYPEIPDYPSYPEYPDRPYIPMYPEVRYETIIQEKIVKVPMPISDDNYFKEVRYMQGFKKEFRPHDGLTRAEAAQILANALVEDGYKYNPDYKLPYKDIGEAWYTRAVKIVTEANVFEGYDDGNFKPQGKITRNEWIATLKRFQELKDLDGNHMNLKDGHWASKEIEAAYNEGWLKIYSDGLAKYEGDKFIPREEVAAVSNKAFKRTLDKTYIRNNEKSLITYKDVNRDMWSYEDILCASNTFLNKKDLYRAHWINEDNNTFNIDTRDFEIVKAKFQRNPR
ncbi:InlB B-repeat-containing protein [Peptoniphilus phoceensis]|uniref:InlB B-repeat-containing protein n=1 Tax=Peptoniphilus phoceensis TaxID=1720298 RepID=UPI0009E6A0E4|nr:S-layer homology domain-containing protein [Peptoniphilus phoceensis]